MIVEVYRNLHKKCYSIRHKGRVLYHAKSIVMRDCEFRVQEGGRKRVLRERKKNVHAYIKGEMVTAAVISKWTWEGAGKHLEREKEKKEGTDWIAWTLDTLSCDEVCDIILANGQRRWFKARYNPYYMPHFFAVGSGGDIPISKADWVTCDEYGMAMSGGTAKTEFMEYSADLFEDSMKHYKEYQE